jgi:hypothetical protein
MTIRTEEETMYEFTRRSALALIPCGLAVRPADATPTRRELQEAISDYLHARNIVFVANGDAFYKPEMMPDFFVVKNRRKFLLDVEQYTDPRRNEFLIKITVDCNATYAVVQSVEDVKNLGL